MTERLSLTELESYLWGAATLLRGLVDAGDYKQFIFPLLFYKRLSDVWGEEYAAALAETGDAAYARATADDRFAIPDGSDALLFTSHCVRCPNYAFSQVN